MRRGGKGEGRKSTVPMRRGGKGEGRKSSSPLASEEMKSSIPADENEKISPSSRSYKVPVI